MAFIELTPRIKGRPARKKGVFIEIKKATYKPLKKDTVRKWDILFQIHVSILEEWGVVAGDTVNILIDDKSSQQSLSCKMIKTRDPQGAYRMCKNSPTLGYIRLRWPSVLRDPTNERSFSAKYEIKNKELLMWTDNKGDTQ